MQEERISSLLHAKNALQDELLQLQNEMHPLSTKMIEYGADADHYKGLYGNLLNAFSEQQEAHRTRLFEVEQEHKHVVQSHHDTLIQNEMKSSVQMEYVEECVRQTLEKKERTITSLQKEVQTAQQQALSAENILKQFTENV